MTWVQLDDAFPEHPKILALSDRAYRAQVDALCYCNRNLTDGLVPRAWAKGRPIKELEGAGLWEPCEQGWRIHDYLDWNPSRQQVHERTAQKAAAGRASAEARAQRTVEQAMEHDVNPPHHTTPVRTKVRPDSQVSSTHSLASPNGSARRDSERTKLKDALVSASDYDRELMTPSTWKKVEAAAKEAAEGRFTPGDVFTAAAWFRRHYPRATVTPQGIVGAFPMAGGP